MKERTPAEAELRPALKNLRRHIRRIPLSVDLLAEDLGVWERAVDAVLDELDPAKPSPDAPLIKPITGWRKEKFNISCKHCGKPIIEVTEQRGKQSWMHRGPGGFHYWCEDGNHHHYALPEAPEVQPRTCQHCGEDII